MTSNEIQRTRYRSSDCGSTRARAQVASRNARCRCAACSAIPTAAGPRRGRRTASQRAAEGRRAPALPTGRDCLWLKPSGRRVSSTCRPCWTSCTCCTQPAAFCSSLRGASPSSATSGTQRCGRCQCALQTSATDQIKCAAKWRGRVAACAGAHLLRVRQVASCGLARLPVAHPTGACREPFAICPPRAGTFRNGVRNAGRSRRAAEAARGGTVLSAGSCARRCRRGASAPARPAAHASAGSDCSATLCAHAAS